ncbi:MAG: DNA adenine methylase [Pseudomonadota bacterium]
MSIKNLASVRPAKPVAPWIGGKSRLAKTIIARIEQQNHTCYAEPFVGMGGVFLRRIKRPKCEVINDLNGELINLFRIIQHHHEAFIELISWGLASREEFDRLLSTSPDTLTDLQRASRFLYIQNCCYSGRIDRPTFGIQRNRASRFNSKILIKRLKAVHVRLSSVQIEKMEWNKLIERYDAVATLFYIDPPYMGSESCYGYGMFGRVDFERMAALLGSIKGRFILSLNDVPEVRKLFGRFHIKEVETTYQVAGMKNAKHVQELLISN